MVPAESDQKPPILPKISLANDDPPPRSEVRPLPPPPPPKREPKSLSPSRESPTVEEPAGWGGSLDVSGLLVRLVELGCPEPLRGLLVCPGESLAGGLLGGGEEREGSLLRNELRSENDRCPESRPERGWCLESCP